MKNLTKKSFTLTLLIVIPLIAMTQACAGPLDSDRSAFYEAQGEYYYNYIPTDIQVKYAKTISKVDKLLWLDGETLTSKSPNFNLNAYSHLIIMDLLHYNPRVDSALKKQIGKLSDAFRAILNRPEEEVRAYDISHFGHTLDEEEPTKIRNGRLRPDPIAAPPNAKSNPFDRAFWSYPSIDGIRLKPSINGSGYDVMAAIWYAWDWRYTNNPDYNYYYPYNDDCTDYISQVLYAGGIPTVGWWHYTDKSNWYYHWWRPSNTWGLLRRYFII